MCTSINRKKLSEMDFEGPSFSLGLDEEVHGSRAGHAALCPSNPFKIVEPGRKEIVMKADAATSNRKASTDSDSDFESQPPSNTERIMKRLKRKSGQQVSGLPSPQQQAQHTNSINEGEIMHSQSISKASNKVKTSLSGKTPAGKTGGSKVQTLQSFWKGMDGKSTLNLPADSGCEDLNGNKVGYTGQRFGPSMPSMVVKPSARMRIDQNGASQTCEGTTLDSTLNVADKHLSVSKTGVCQGYAESACSKKQGFLSPGYDNRPHTDNEDLLEKRVLCKSDAMQRSETCIDVDSQDEPATSNAIHSTSTVQENPLDQEVHTLGKSVVGPNMTSKDHSHLELPSNSSQGKTDGIITSHNKTNALHSFWKSLNEKKASFSGTDLTVDEDDIENYSSDDDFGAGTHSGRKLSFYGNATTCKSFGLENQAAGLSSGPVQKSKSLIDALSTPRLPSHSAANVVSAYPNTYQSCNSGDASGAAPVYNYKNVQTKHCSSLEKPPDATSKDFQWPYVDDTNDDGFFFSCALNKDTAINDCETPSHASKANAFGDSCSPFVEPFLHKDSRVAHLLRVRLPHFTNVSALRQGNFMGSEQVYIDYGRQFSGLNTTSCQQSGPKDFKHHAQQATRRQAAPKRQKIAMADNDGWIQTGNRTASKNYTAKSNRGRKGSQQVCSQTPNTDNESSLGAGYWVTERTGKRIYITKDGQKLSGSSAYKQHMKDSGKRFKKTKRRRPRSKK